MDLRKTIAELEEQARQFTEAANTLRALAGSGEVAAKPGRKAGRKPATGKAVATKAAKKASGKKRGRKAGTKAPMTDETRAKIAEALRKAHARRKATK